MFLFKLSKSCNIRVKVLKTDGSFMRDFTVYPCQQLIKNFDESFALLGVKKKIQITGSIHISVF